MFSFHKKWLKIYLFYGGIFFLLGLTGYLASDEYTITNWALSQYKNITNLTGLSKTTKWWEQDPETAVFAERHGKILLFAYPNHGRDQQFNFLVKQLQTLLQANFEKIITVPLERLNDWDDIPNDSLEQAESWIVIGYRQIPLSSQNNDSNFQCKLSFSLPEAFLHQFTAKFMGEISQKLSAYTLQKQCYRYANLMELSWVQSNAEEEQTKDVMKIFLDNLRLDHGLRLPGGKLN